MGFTAHAKRCVPPTARCHQGQSCFRVASDSGAWPLLCMQMEKGIIKTAIEIAVSNPSTVNRYFPLCSSKEISINIPKAQDCSRDLLVPTVLFLSPSLQITWTRPFTSACLLFRLVGRRLEGASCLQVALQSLQTAFAEVSLLIQ